MEIEDDFFGERGGIKVIPFPDKKYQIIYADPPWAYRNSPSKKGTTRVFAKNHYCLMPTREICALPVEEIAGKDSVLLLWTTKPMLPDALRVIEAWGFTYRTCAFVWVKKNKKAGTNFWGGGYYTRSNTEDVLLATKGKILPRLSRSIHQIIEAPVGRHSAKPPEVRERIIELFGDLPRIELFARERVEGWDVWGDEIEGGFANE